VQDGRGGHFLVSQTQSTLRCFAGKCSGEADSPTEGLAAFACENANKNVSNRSESKNSGVSSCLRPRAIRSVGLIAFRAHISDEWRIGACQPLERNGPPHLRYFRDLLLQTGQLHKRHYVPSVRQREEAAVTSSKADRPVSHSTRLAESCQLTGCKLPKSQPCC
jgi:hypothetical protein